MTSRKYDRGLIYEMWRVSLTIKIIIALTMTTISWQFLISLTKKPNLLSKRALKKKARRLERRAWHSLHPPLWRILWTNPRMMVMDFKSEKCRANLSLECLVDPSRLPTSQQFAKKVRLNSLSSTRITRQRILVLRFKSKAMDKSIGKVCQQAGSLLLTIASSLASKRDGLM